MHKYAYEMAKLYKVSSIIYIPKSLNLQQSLNQSL